MKIFDIYNKDHGSLPELGDSVKLINQTREVVACQETGVKMLNIDADQLAPGDLTFIKKLGLTISNPDTDKPVALGVDFTPETFGHKLKKWFESDDDDDSHYFSSGSEDDDDSSSGGGFSFGGGSSFGGFGGGGFGGGGASGGF